MKTIRIPMHAVITIAGGKRDPIAETAARIDAAAVPWDINKPKDAAERLHAALSEGTRVRVAMRNAHAPARRQASSIARKHGAQGIVIRLPGGAPVDKDAEKHDAVYDVDGPDAFQIEWVPMPSDKRHLTGPFDMIGDVHGVHDELMDLLAKLGHVDPETGLLRRHPEGRIPVMLGDYTDRGPANRAVLETVREITRMGGLAILGNHDEKVRKWLQGRDVLVAAGLAMTVAELADITPEWRTDMAEWLGTLETHYVLDGGRLVVAHAGLSEEHHGRHTGGARSMAMYGKPIEGGTVLDEDGYPLAEDWAQSYAGTATVVHGHVVHPEPRQVNNVVAVDTGAVFGGSLTAYRWPERDFVSVKARRAYFERRVDTDGDQA